MTAVFKKENLINNNVNLMFVKRRTNKIAAKGRHILLILIVVAASILFAKLGIYLSNCIALSRPLFGSYNIEPIFIIYLLFLAAMCRVKNRQWAMTMIYVSFLIIFVCSKCGADYESYKAIYEQVKMGIPFQNIHGEILYLAINRLASFVMPFELFKIIYLSFFLLILCYSLYRLTPNPMLAFLLLYCGMTLYLLTILRQFATISFFFYSLWLIKRKKNITALLLTFLSSFIHIGGIVGFSVVLYLVFFGSFIKTVSGKKACVLIALAIVSRLILMQLLQLPSLRMFVDMNIVYNDIRFFTLGTLSRMTELLILAFSQKAFCVNSLNQRIYNVYNMAMLLYLSIPLEFFMARLLISFRFVVALLASNMTGSGSRANVIGVARKRQVFSMDFVCILVMFVALFVYQLAFQVGYTPYTHIFL